MKIKKADSYFRAGFLIRELNPEGFEFTNQFYLVNIIFFTSTKFVPSIPVASILYK